MPKVKAGETESDYMARCVPEVKAEGLTQEQAVGKCMGMFKNAQKAAAITSMMKGLEDVIREEEENELVAKYQPELLEKAETVGGYTSPEPGDLGEAGKKLLAKVYAKCRKDGGDKTYCSKVAWTAVNNAGYKSNNISAMRKIEKNMRRLLEIRKSKTADMANIEMARDKPSNTYFSQIKVPAFLMSPPLNVDNSQPNNPWMKGKNLAPFNYDKAEAQWKSLVDVINSVGMVFLLPAWDGLQDEVYVANLGIMLPQSIRRDTVILSNFRSSPRAGEENIGHQFFSSMQFSVNKCPHFFEGLADLKWLRDDIFIGGYGVRTDPEAFDWMMKEYGIKIIKVKMNDKMLYHFDTMCFPLDEKTVILCTEIMDEADVAAVKDVAEIIDIPRDICTGTTNCVRAGNMILNNSNLDELEQGTEEYDQEKKRTDWLTNVVIKKGLQPVFVNLSEFDKGGADLSCLVMQLSTSRRW